MKLKQGTEKSTEQQQAGWDRLQNLYLSWL